MTREAERRPAVPRRERGAASVADRVVAKIAAQVAREALSRFSEPTGHVPPGHRTPHVTAVVRGAPERAGGPAGSRPALGQARMRIAVELGYPSDIGAQCAAVRREVTDRVAAWAGVEVSDLVVAVARLHSAHSRRTERERVR
ncbi:Asp23/Gls24 family envelope stress response protein [Streptomyces sp. ML-6]|nr:Asp23/Gls24 family envelope stress response protein [Streptomyces sp. ML-6]MDK0520565.1 Asp23/Gls24 family envelope stress response protein [Streptomyces sp. ML-6]